MIWLRYKTLVIPRLVDLKAVSCQLLHTMFGEREIMNCHADDQKHQRMTSCNGCVVKRIAFISGVILLRVLRGDPSLGMTKGCLTQKTAARQKNGCSCDGSFKPSGLTPLAFKLTHTETASKHNSSL